MTRVRRPSHHLEARCSIGAPTWHKILGPFQDHHIAPDVKYLSKSFFYRLSRSHRFNTESLSQFSLPIVKGWDELIPHPTWARKDLYPKR